MKLRLLMCVLGLVASGYAMGQDYQKYATTPNGSSLYFDNGGPLNTGDFRIDGIAGGRKWGGPLGTGAIISYSFPSSNSVWADDYAHPTDGRNEPSKGVFEFTENEKSMARDAMYEWQNVANIIFVEVQETSTQVGDIRMAWTSETYPVSTIQVWSSLPGPGRWADIWWDVSIRAHASNIYNLFVGTMVHELGHSIGLAHNAGGSTNLPSNLDHKGNTVMSYNQAPMIAGVDPTWLRPKAFDIAAVRYLYGEKGSADLFNPPAPVEVTIDPESSAGKAIRIIVTTFGSTFLTPEYINAGTDLFERGNSVVAVAQAILDFPAFQAIVSPADDNGFIQLVIGNIFGRAPTEGEVVLVTALLLTTTKAELIVMAADLVDPNQFK